MGRNQIPYLSEICSIQPYCLDNDDTITSPYDIADAFDDYFGSIAETTKKQNILITFFRLSFKWK